jgi:cystathionine gamma-synthase
MNPLQLLESPLWQEADLGAPLPDSIHAVSVALPRWEDVVGYEEKNPEVMSRLRGGYPRFVIHPLVQMVADLMSGGQPCLPFPSEKAAQCCAEFVHQTTGDTAHIVSGSNGSATLYGVATAELGAPALKTFWQHTGLIVSTRQAEAFLEGEGPQNAGVHRSLRRQLAGFYDCDEDDVFLTPTGMAAQFAALQAVRKRSPGQETAQLGFPYADTLKLQEKFGSGATLLHDLASISHDLEALLSRQPLAACFCEIPGNPTLGSADVRLVTPLLRRHRVPLVIDDVVATPFNVDLSDYADLIATSLTKYIAGSGDVMGGAVICNPKSPLYRELKSILKAQHEELLFPADAAVIDAQAHGFPERMELHNENGLFLAEKLRNHPAVERVWYPQWEFSEAYEAVRRPGRGWGSLITFLPKNAEVEAPRIYDALAFCKGPSLGTVFTLACPFTYLAHYKELDWAEACGVPRYLIRISAGLEEGEELWRRLEAAL